MMQRAEMLLDSPELVFAQVQQLLANIGLPQQQVDAASPTLNNAGGVNPGSQNLGGAQLQRPGEGNIQRGRVASNQGQPSVFPQGLGGLDFLGSALGNPTGGAVGVPSGQTVRR